MNLFGWVLLVAVGVAALTDWVTVSRRSEPAEQLARPAFMVLLLALAWLLHADGVAHGRWLLAGLALSLAGDAIVLGRSRVRFQLGLLSVLLARLAYLGAVVWMPHAVPRWLGVTVVGLLVVVAVGTALGPLPRRKGTAAGQATAYPAGPATAYAVVLGLFVGYAWYSGHPAVAVGASLLGVSDAVFGLTRSVAHLPQVRLVVAVTYDLGQLLVVLGILRPDVMPGG